MDRAEAIRVLEQEQRYLMGGVMPNMQEYDEALEMAIAALREQEQSKWISVKERKPESPSRCLVSRYDEVTKTNFTDILWFEKGNWWNRLYQGNYRVTHWMPLPEPPEGGADDGKV